MIRPIDILYGAGTLLGIDTFFWLIGIAEGAESPPISEYLSHVQFLSITGIGGTILLGIWYQIKRNRK